MGAKLLLWLSLIALLSATLALGQEVTSVTGDIPFAFVVSGKTLPAGHYSFVPSADGLTMRIVGADKNNLAVVRVVTRLGGPIHTTAQDSHIVFDSVGGVYTLSEIWVPDLDGWMLAATKGKHEHRVVDIPR